MTVTPGFKVSRSRTERARREGPTTALPEQGDAQRLERLSNFLKDLGDDRMAYIGEIGKLWKEAQERFLTIGRYLARAKDRLPHGAFEAMVADELPFGKHVAWQLRTVAAAVDGGRIDEEDLPRSYTTAYKLAQLDDERLARAKREGLVRSDVTRDDIARFLRRSSEEALGSLQHLDRLVEEREVLKRQLRKLAEQQRNAKRRLSEIDSQLSGKVIEGRAQQEEDTQAT